MTCTYTVYEMLGSRPAPDQPPDQITVRGTVESEDHDPCTTVRIDIFTQGQVVTTAVPVADDGSWTAVLNAGEDFDQGDFQCSVSYKIDVRCAEGGRECRTQRFSADLVCSGCPAATVTWTEGDCTGTGQHRAVDLHVSFTGSNETIVYEWDFGDGENSNAQVYAGAEETTTHQYDAAEDGATYTATLRIILPQGCADQEFEIGPITPCDPPVVECRLRLVVRNADRAVVDPDDGCLPEGTYSVEVVEPAPPPAGDDHAFGWTIDGQLDTTNQGRTRGGINLASGQSIEIGVAVITGPCAGLSDEIQLEACICPDAPTLRVTRPDGTPAPGCVAPGTYLVEAVGDDLDADEITWTVNGTNAGNGTVVNATVDAADGMTCDQGQAGSLVEATVRPPNCPERTASVFLNICRENRFNPCCFVMRMLLILMLLVAFLGGMVAICPALAMPLVPDPTTASAIGIVILTIGLIGAAIVFGMIRMMRCSWTWCSEVFPMVWQLLFGAGVILIYFSGCPVCSPLFLIPGIALFLTGASLILVWRFACRPSPCRYLLELAGLAGVQSLIALLELVFIACVGVGGGLFLAVVIAVLVNGVLLSQLFNGCLTNPNAGNEA